MKRFFLTYVLIYLSLFMGFSQRSGQTYNPAAEFTTCTTIESVEEFYRNNYRVFLKCPSRFSPKVGYGACANIEKAIGQEYLCIFQSCDNNCNIIVPAIHTKSRLSCHDIMGLDLKEQAGNEELITKISGALIKQSFNADSLVLYCLPVNSLLFSPGNDPAHTYVQKDFSFALRVILCKHDNKCIPLIILLTNKGKRNLQKYFERIQFNIQYLP